MACRPTSSVYSDQFQLDDLLDHLSGKVVSQSEHAFQTLLKENKEASAELNYFRSSWSAIYELMTEVNDILCQLTAVVDQLKARIEREQMKYKANCTAI